MESQPQWSQWVEAISKASRNAITEGDINDGITLHSILPRSLDISLRSASWSQLCRILPENTQLVPNFESPVGTFRMISSIKTRSKNDGETVPFQIMAHEVTVDKFKQYIPEVRLRSPSYYNRSSHMNMPAVSITLSDAIALCKVLTNKGRTENGGYWAYRVPTVPEWQLAAIGKAKTGFCIGNPPKNKVDLMNWEKRMDRHSWNANNSNGHSEVMSKEPNFNGLYDVHGSVAEWCLQSEDDFVKALNGAPVSAVISGGHFRSKYDALNGKRPTKTDSDTVGLLTGVRLVRVWKE